MPARWHVVCERLHDKCADVFVRAVVPQITGLLAGTSQQCGWGGYRHHPRVIWARGARVRRFRSAALLALLGMRVEMDDSRIVFVIAELVSDSVRVPLGSIFIYVLLELHVPVVA